MILLLKTRWLLYILKLSAEPWLKPRLHDKFLCDNFSYFYVRNVFGRVDETANNC
jgi:hypothetical protein